MRIEMHNGVVSATAETLEDNQTLLALANAPVTPQTAKPRRKYKTKYSTEAERAKAKRLYARRWYRKNKEAVAARRMKVRRLEVRDESPTGYAIAA